MSGPITPHGTTVVNAAYDFTHFAKAHRLDSNIENHSIHKGDAVFVDKKLAKRKRAVYNEPELHVLATTNGVVEECLKHDNYSFVGISHAHIDSSSRRHCAVTVAGLTTMANTGPNAIEAGDKVVWDFAPSSSTGPKSNCRKLFRTIPYHTAFENGCASHFEELMSAIQPGVDPKSLSPDLRLCAELLSDADVSVDQFTKMKEFLKCYVLRARSLDNRIIGTALSKAATSGTKFDCLVRHSH
jgi:hypothetical protein